MAVRIKFEAVLNNFEDVATMRDHIVAWDEYMAGKDDAIKAENVQASDVLAVYFAGDLDDSQMVVTVNEMEEA